MANRRGRSTRAVKGGAPRESIKLRLPRGAVHARSGERGWQVMAPQRGKAQLRGLKKRVRPWPWFEPSSGVVPEVAPL